MNETKKTRIHVPTEKFIRVYLAHDTYEEIAKELGVQTMTVRQRVYNWQKRGIKITPKKSDALDTRSLNVDEINKMLTAK